MLSVESKRLAASATTKVSAEREHNRPLLLPDTKRREKFFEREASRGSGYLDGDIKKRADLALRETVRNRHVTIGILTCVNIT